MKKKKNLKSFMSTILEYPKYMYAVLIGLCILIIIFVWYYNFIVIPQKQQVEDLLPEPVVFELYLKQPHFKLYICLIKVLDCAYLMNYNEHLVNQIWFENTLPRELMGMTGGFFFKMLKVICFRGFFDQYHDQLLAIEALDNLSGEVTLKFFDYDSGSLLHEGRVKVWSLKLFTRYILQYPYMTGDYISHEVYNSVCNFYLTKEDVD